MIFARDKSREGAIKLAISLRELALFNNHPYSPTQCEIPKCIVPTVLVKCFYSYETWETSIDICESIRTENIEYCLIGRNKDGICIQHRSPGSPEITRLLIHICTEDYLFFQYFPAIYSSNVEDRPWPHRTSSLYVSLDVSYIKYSHLGPNHSRTWETTQELVAKFLDSLRPDFTPFLAEYFKNSETGKLYFLGCVYVDSTFDPPMIASYFKRAYDMGHLLSGSKEKCFTSSKLAEFYKYIRVVDLTFLKYVDKTEAQIFWDISKVKKRSFSDLEQIQTVYYKTKQHKKN